MLRRKDGSLNLSIQAIVILVMAMAVLGLGLGFIRSIFSSGGTKLIGEIENINIMQASDTQTMVATNTVKTDKGGYSQLQVSLYNKDNTGTDPKYTIKVGCDSSSVTVSCITEIEVPLKKARNFGCAVTASDTGYHVCQINATVTPNTGPGSDLTTTFFVETTV